MRELGPMPLSRAFLIKERGILGRKAVWADAAEAIWTEAGRNSQDVAAGRAVQLRREDAV